MHFSVHWIPWLLAASLLLLWGLLLAHSLRHLRKHPQVEHHHKIKWRRWLIWLPIVGLLIYKLQGGRHARKLIAPTLLVLATALFATWLLIFYIPTTNVVERQVDAAEAPVVDAAQLVNLYSTNEALANQQYLDKVVTVHGRVVEASADSLMHVTLGRAEEMSHVFCELDAGQPKPAAGDSVAITGICTGMLTDVVLVKGKMKSL